MPLSLLADQALPHASRWSLEHHEAKKELRQSDGLKEEAVKFILRRADYAPGMLVIKDLVRSTT